MIDFCFLIYSCLGCFQLRLLLSFYHVSYCFKNFMHRINSSRWGYSLLYLLSLKCKNFWLCTFIVFKFGQKICFKKVVKKPRCTRRSMVLVQINLLYMFDCLIFHNYYERLVNMFKYFWMFDCGVKVFKMIYEINLKIEKAAIERAIRYQNLKAKKR